MKHEKINFAGTELDAVIGHPEHELLFVAKQVADAAGLKEGSNRIMMFAKSNEGLMRVSEMPVSVTQTLIDYPRIQGRSWLISESSAYTLLLSGRAPQSEPFRKWVTEEVLPSIRKTGSYDLAKSDTPEAKQVADDFAAMRAALDGLTAEVKSLKTLIEELKAQGPAAAAEALSS
ncbi:BRO family protein [Mixta sp. Marseille-Q2659]|uniref:BRO-N domain-containing protein n=1 Tax=Mixta sp. Marseille-Q2659 TaxID=2736607 RepID=UPI0023B8D102|nr:BRO family protein [Mixta sp. Marseille-Q2659]